MVGASGFVHSGRALFRASGFVHSGRARREEVLDGLVGVARGMRRNRPLYVGVPLDDGGGDEV